MSLPTAQQAAKMTVSFGHLHSSIPAVSQRRFPSCQSPHRSGPQRSTSQLSVLPQLQQRNCARANERGLQKSSSSSPPVPASVSVALTASLAFAAAATLTFTAPAVAEPLSPLQHSGSYLEASIDDIRRFQIDLALVTASLESPPVISGSIATALIHQEQQQQQQQQSIASPSSLVSTQQRGNEVQQLAAAPVDPAQVDLPLAAPDSQVSREGAAVDASSAPAAPPVLDAAHVLSSSRLQAVQQQVEQLERERGWKVKVLTRDGKLPTAFRDAAATWQVSSPS